MPAYSSLVERFEAGARTVPASLAASRRLLKRALNLNDFQRLAKGRLPDFVYSYVASGSEDQVALASNLEAFHEWRLVPRVLVGAAAQDQRRSLFGHTYASPFGITPMGGSAMVTYEGDTVLARAARAAGIPFVLSGNSVIPMEEVARQAPGSWFAAYQSPNRRAIEGMVARVTLAGFSVFVLTADVPVGSNRESDERAGFSMPLRPKPQLAWDSLRHPRWLASTLAPTLAKRGIPRIANLEPEGGPRLLSPKAGKVSAHKRLSWEHVRLIRGLWKGILVIKGILSKEDARIARECGADGIVISNHGGRQFDRAPTPLQVLPEIAAEARGMTIMIDGGFRRGTDVLTALALGADFVFIGRPFLFAAALSGEAGVAHAISLLTREIETDMALLGLRSLDELRPDILLRARDGARHASRGADGG